MTPEYHRADEEPMIPTARPPVTRTDRDDTDATRCHGPAGDVPTSTTIAGPARPIRKYVLPRRDAEISFPDGQTLSLGNPQTEAAVAAAKRAE